MQDIQKQVGARVRELREKKGLSQETLADLCNLHRTYVGLIERGERNLSLRTLEVIAGGLGVAVSELFSGLEQTPPAHRRSTRKRSLPITDLAAHVATIRQILLDAKLTDARRYEALFKANREGRTE